MRLKGSRGFSAKVLAYLGPSTTGENKSVTGIGFKPYAVLHANSLVLSKNAVVNAIGAEPCGMGFWNQHGEQFSNSIYSKDGLAGANPRQSRSNDVSADVTQFSGIRFNATYRVGHYDGWNYAATNAAPRYQVALAIALPPSVRLAGGVRMAGGVHLA